MTTKKLLIQATNKPDSNQTNMSEMLVEDMIIF